MVFCCALSIVSNRTAPKPPMVRTRWDGPTSRRIGPPVHCDQFAHEASSTQAFGVAWRGNLALLCPDLAGLAVVMGRMDGQ